LTSDQVRQNYHSLVGRILWENILSLMYLN
jgi:hypothetical protein